MIIFNDKSRFGKMNERISPNSERLKIALAHLDAHFTDPQFMVKTWAILMTMSVSNFSRLLRKETKQSPSVHLQNKRLEHALKLLTETNKSITEIATASGFADNNYFSRYFKTKFTLSPTDWREVHKKR
jgi:transcriptional regulator GlxA family with amidase domain